MFNNIGRKIKILAQVIFWFFSIPCAIAGIVFIGLDDDFLAIGLPLLFGGPIVFWVSSCFLYGFGEIIENTAKIAANTKGAQKSEPDASAEKAENPRLSEPGASAEKAENPRLTELRKLFESGLISEEEYNEALAKEV